MELRRSEIEVDELVQLYKSLSRECNQLRPWDDANVRSSTEEEEAEAEAKSSITVAEDDQDQKISLLVEENVMEKKASTSLDLLTLLESMQRRIQDLYPMTDKFRQRMTMKDPITSAPRYGEQTFKRVSQLLQQYDTLKIRIDDAFVGNDDGNHNASNKDGENTQMDSSLSFVDHLQRQIQLQKERQEAEGKRKQMDLESTLRAQDELRIQAEEKMIEERAQEEARLQQEREDLAKRAEVSRRERMELERKLLEEEMRRYQMQKEADEAFLASIPKGLDGVKEQLKILRQSCCDKNELDTALGALHTLFSQIQSNPEEIKFRRIRRDHPQFLNDIGRHDGGKEVLVAAGFTFADVDKVKCFFSKEPDIEKDMDGWSNWFNLIQNTISAIEEEMMK